MDISPISALSALNGLGNVGAVTLTGTLGEQDTKTDGTMFDAFLNTITAAAE